MKKIVLYFALAFTLITCEDSPVTRENKLNVNYTGQYEISMDYTDALSQGFSIPSNPNQRLKFIFSSKDYIGKYFKIYYQNESYKFPDNHKFSTENFYGSWENTDIGFKKIKNNSTEIEFRILGNPRNESKYFGEISRALSEEEQNKQIVKTEQQILSSKEWKESVKKKAAQNNISFDIQLRNDATWVASKQKTKDSINNRWKRNPRVGQYSFLLVVVDSNEISGFPEGVVNLSATKQVNPFNYFLNTNKSSKISVQKINNFINLKASPPLNKGIFIADNINSSKNEFFNKYVNTSDSLRQNAAFEYHQQHPGAYTQPLKNLPIKEDLLGDNFSIEAYEKYVKEYDSKRIGTHFSNSDYPGETFGYDENKKTLWFKNPGNKEGQFKKENIGIKTRHGLAYGKYTFKIKMAELLNKDNVWTGLTNAIWMITQSLQPWNERRSCKKGGYMPYYGAGEGVDRVPVISYSEMDFEMVKAPKYWPESYYKDKSKHKDDPAANKENVMVTCTNFDMACLEPKNFKEGAVEHEYKGKKYTTFRWNEYHNALHLKTAHNDDKLFKDDYYYFQIEWKPMEIIWRIGPEKDKLEVVGYMNDNMTNIANNQMVCVITQEYHYSSWWPGSPFLQENIPFPSKDLEGQLYSIEIE